MQPRNPAARAGRWSAQHRKTAIFGWILFVVLATVVGGKIGQNSVDDSARGSGESKRGDMIVKAADFPEQADERVLVQGADGTERGAAVQDVMARLGRIEGVSGIERPVASKDGRSVVVDFKLAGTDEQAKTRVARPLAAVAAAQAAHPGVRVEEFGDASAAKEIAARDTQDGKKAEGISYALLLIILLAAFGAIVAAGVPLVLGATSVAATVGLLGPVSQLYALPPDVAELAAIIGLAVGVDYAMFYSRRMTEERDRGHSAEAAIEIAAATSGRAVLISGLTVMTAMAGLLLAGNPIFVGFGIGTMLVVAVALLGSMTFLPAMLAFLEPQELAGEGPRAVGHQAPPPGQGRVARVGRGHLPRPQAPRGVDGAGRAACSSRSPSRRSGSSSRRPATTATRAASRSSRPTTGSRPPSPAAPSRP